MQTSVDLSQIPQPDIVEVPDFETALADIQALIVAAMPVELQASVSAALLLPHSLPPALPVLLHLLPPVPAHLPQPEPVQTPAVISGKPDNSAAPLPAVPDWKLLIWRHSVSAVPHRIY